MDYNYHAGHVLAAYVWRLLRDELGWTADDYGGVIPVVPTQQQPELASATGPFIVFASSIDQISTLWLMTAETVAFTVYSPEDSDINSVTQLVVDRLKRYDESAKLVNDFITTLPDGHKAKKFDFKTIMVRGASGPQPSLQEYGRKDGNIIIRAEYTRE